MEQPWPCKGIIDLLVQWSSGQFIYAMTVLKFLGANFCSPTKQLDLVLKPDPTVFSDSDKLYTQILSVIQAAMWTLSKFWESSLSWYVVCCLEDEDGEPEDDAIFHFAHASLSDYLFDSSHSGRFYVNQQGYGNQFTIRSFAIIIQLIRSWR